MTIITYSHDELENQLKD